MNPEINVRTKFIFPSFYYNNINKKIRNLNFVSLNNKLILAKVSTIKFIKSIYFPIFMV